jgi:hypothetical protein
MAGAAAAGTGVGGDNAAASTGLGKKLALFAMGRLICFAISRAASPATLARPSRSWPWARSPVCR